MQPLKLCNTKTPCIRVCSISRIQWQGLLDFQERICPEYITPDLKWSRRWWVKAKYPLVVIGLECQCMKLRELWPKLRAAVRVSWAHPECLVTRLDLSKYVPRNRSQCGSIWSPVWNAKQIVVRWLYRPWHFDRMSLYEWIYGAGCPLTDDWLRHPVSALRLGIDSFTC